LPFTQIPFVSGLINRTFGGVTIPSTTDWLITLAVLFGLNILAIGIIIGVIKFVAQSTYLASSFNFATYLLEQHSISYSWCRSLLTLIRFFFVPALLEEYLFRVLLIPYPKPWISAFAWWSWAILALGIYLVYCFVWTRRLGRSSYADSVNHFRAWWSDCSDQIIGCDSPGPASSDLSTFNFTKKTRKLYPLDADAVYPEPVWQA
jgi:predicted Abi (CAAX) family protease